MFRIVMTCLVASVAGDLSKFRCVHQRMAPEMQRQLPPTADMPSHTF